MDKEMKENELVNQCTSITIEEIDRMILQENKKEFKRKHIVNSLMGGRVEEIRKETIEIWNKFLTKNRLVESNSQDRATRAKNPLILDEGKMENT